MMDDQTDHEAAPFADVCDHNPAVEPMIGWMPRIQFEKLAWQLKDASEDEIEALRATAVHRDEALRQAGQNGATT